MNSRSRTSQSGRLFVAAAILCGASLLGFRVGDAGVSLPDADAVEAVARDYIEGWYSGDVERMDRALHDDLVKRMPVRDDSSQVIQLRPVSKARMLELTGGGGGENPNAVVEIFVDDVSTDIAAARVVSPDYLDYLQLAKTGDGWKIVNVLFTRAIDTATAPGGHMGIKSMWRRLRGALGVGSLWGSIWFAGAVSIIALFGPTGVNLGLAFRFGFTGFLAGAAFGGALAWVYRNREISDIGSVGFVLLGAVVAGLFFPGNPMLPALFGATAAGITIKLARRPAEPLESGGPIDLFPKPLL